MSDRSALKALLSVSPAFSARLLTSRPRMDYDGGPASMTELPHQPRAAGQVSTEARGHPVRT